MKDAALVVENWHLAACRGSTQELWKKEEILFRRPSFSGLNCADSETNLLNFDIA